MNENTCVNEQTNKWGNRWMNMGNRCQGTVFIVFTKLAEESPFSVFRAYSLFKKHSVSQAEDLWNETSVNSSEARRFPLRGRCFPKVWPPCICEHNTLKIKADNSILTCFVPSIKIKIAFPLPYYLLFSPFCLVKIIETPLQTFLLNFFCLKFIFISPHQGCTESEGTHSIII